MPSNPITMKRCCNCGWFNHDSATCCEKCEDTSFEIEDEQVDQIHEVDDHEVEVIPETSKPNKNAFIAATVAFSSSQMSQPVEERVVAAAVVDADEDVSDVVSSEDSISCPKCCYPVSGDTDYCPNCGATIRKPVPVGAQAESSFGQKTVMCPVQEDLMETVAEDAKGFSVAQTVPIGAGGVPDLKVGSGDLKATVAEIDSFCSDDESDCSRLVPVDALGEPDILLRPGEQVVILGKKYRFVK